ncbi:MAG: methyltransferase domain-containing protein [Bacteroidia bacterium]
MSALPAKYKIKTEHLDVFGVTVQVDRVVNLDDLFEELIGKGEDDEDVMDERIPYWADLWHSSIALARHIVKSKIIKRNMHVLEIGCGLGLPGIVAGKFSDHITFTDYIKEPLEFAKHNWNLNNDFEAQFKILDWRKPDASVSADLVLASDVAYEKRSFKHLHKAFKKLIKPGGMILMSEPNRNYAKEFFSTLKNNGFVFSEFLYPINYNNITTKVNVYEIKMVART